MIYKDQELMDQLGKELKMSDTVNRKLAGVYNCIRSGEVRQEAYHRAGHLRVCAASAAAAVVVVAGGVVCVSNPTFASNLPLIGHLFEKMEDVASYSGDYSKVGEPVAGNVEETTDNEQAAYTQIANGVSVTLSEVYCNEAALYLTFELQVEDGFPDYLVTENGTPDLGLRGEITYSFNSESQPFLEYPDGKMVDDNTYIGLLRFDLQDATTDWTDFNQAVEADGEGYNGESYNKYRDLIHMIDLPESFEVQLSVTQVIGNLAEPTSIFEAAGVAQPSEEEYAEMPEDEWHAMMQGLYDSVPDYGEYPNQYENFWYDGPYTYKFAVNVDSEQTVTVPVDTESDESYYVVSVTKTPFELTVEEVNTVWDADRMLIVIDADGSKLSYGAKGGNTNEFQVEGHDLSSIDIYSVTLDDWENQHIKGDYFEENGTNEDGQTLKEVLDDNNLYHRMVTFN